MSAINEAIVREFFELHGFLVRQDRKYEARGKQEIDGIDFFVWNPQPVQPASPAPFVLDSADLPCVNRALVVVRGWHTESFGPAVLESSPEMFRFVEPAVFQQATRAFSPDLAPLKILIVPALPQTAAARGQIRLSIVSGEIASPHMQVSPPRMRATSSGFKPPASARGSNR